MKTFTQWLIENDFIASAEEESELSEKAKTKLRAQFDADQKPPAPPDPKPSPHGAKFMATLEAERKEKSRIDAIDALAAEAVKAYPTQLDTMERLVKAAHADKTVEPQKFELELLRATRPIGPPQFIVSGEKEAGGKVVEASICRSLGLRDIEKHYDERTLDASDRYFRHGVGLQQLLFKAAAAHGQHYDSVANMRGLMEAAFGRNGRTLEATGFTTFSLPGILSNVMNKFLVDFFNSVESTWRAIAAIRPVRDFKQITSYSLTGANEYQKVGPGGQLKHGQLGEETYTNKADTYGQILAITRTDIINDDLGAFQAVPRRLGRNGALAVNDVFWTEFLDNAAFFTAQRGNFDDGADTAFSLDALTLAETLFLNQTDPDGKPLGVTPSILLTPNALSVAAAQAMNSTELRDTTASTKFGVSNPHAGKFTAVRSSYLSNSAYTGFSALAWYLLANPMDMPVIEVAFLNGRDVPVVESADADFDTLGIQIRAYHDFGVNKQEYRGGVKMKGES